MKIAYFHCFAGASGDMILGALLDAGLPWEQLLADLAMLPCRDFSLERERVVRQGICGTKLRVTVSDDRAHRRLDDIAALLGESTLPEDIRTQSMTIFTRLAEAEGRVHGKAACEIIFHEVGALDAVIDVVGSVAGLRRLGIEEVYASSINVGGGFTTTAHGVIPVPAPATMELVRGVPVYSRGVERELLTPTGAAILTSRCRAFGDMPPLRILASGYGAGDHDLPIPNLLRVTIGEKMAADVTVPPASREGGVHHAQALMMEANIDDMNPEFYDHLISGLLEAGAMDVFLQPIQMKKNRPAVTLSVLIGPEEVDRFSRHVLAETTTLGLRVYPVAKYMLPSEVITLETSLGTTRIKIGRYEGKVCNVAPEYDDCRRIAKEKRMPLKDVYDVIKGEAWRILH